MVRSLAEMRLAALLGAVLLASQFVAEGTQTGGGTSVDAWKPKPWGEVPPHPVKRTPCPAGCTKFGTCYEPLGR
jgi:hypothetical protein